MTMVPPLPGEGSLYGIIRSVLDAAAEDPQIKTTLVQTAIATEKELISPLRASQANQRSREGFRAISRKPSAFLETGLLGERQSGDQSR
jgi:hypothetical protein